MIPGPQFGSAIPPILVGIDFSAGAAAAAAAAVSFAEYLSSPLLAVHVSEDATWRRDRMSEAWMESAGLQADSLVLRRGVPWVELSRLSEELRAPMLVVGTHGLGGYQPVRPGSTAMNLVARSRLPVLLVPPR